MFKDSYWLIILFIFAIIFYYSNNKNIYEGYKNSNVFMGISPIDKKNNQMINNNFGSHSIYEVGKIKNQKNVSGYYDTYYSDYYPGYYSNYYS